MIEEDIYDTSYDEECVCGHWYAVHHAEGPCSWSSCDCDEFEMDEDE